MREARKTQDALREIWLNLDHAKELEAISRVLDAHPKIAELAWQDPPDAPPLQPIRSLAYFLPVLEEVLLEPLPPGYVRYLQDKLDLEDHFSTVLEER